MPRVTGATLTRQMIGRIEQFLAGDKSIQIPEAAMKRYREKLGLTEDTLEEAIEMTIEPERQSQHANPLDDVLESESHYSDDPPPWEEMDDMSKIIVQRQEEEAEKVEDPLPPIEVKPMKVATVKLKKQESKVTVDPSVPKYGDQEWTPYMLKQLMPSEKIVDAKENIKPRCMGMKRLVEMFIGPIVKVESEIVTQPARENGGIYIIKVTVHVRVKNESHPAYLASAYMIEWSDMAQSFVSMDGQSDVVTMHPAASAYTAALSRCLRSILGLSGVYVAEEINTDSRPKIPHDPDNKPMQKLTGEITPKQIAFIEDRCEQYGANPVLCAREACQDDRISALKELTAEEGQKVQQMVNRFQTTSVPNRLSNKA